MLHFLLLKTMISSWFWAFFLFKTGDISYQAFYLQDFVPRMQSKTQSKRPRDRSLGLFIFNYFPFFNAISLTMILHSLRHLRQSCKSSLQILLSRNIISHHTVVKLLIRHHVKISGTGQTKDDGLLLTGLLAL